MSEKINREPVLPIKEIGEERWIENLTSFLENHDVEVISLENDNAFQKVEQDLDWIIPSQIKNYFLYFGGIESSDFMYNLKKIDEWEILTDSIWEFVSINFQPEETDRYIVFSESPSNDPICFKKDTGEIYLFSHDPIAVAKVYKNFNDYLLNEIIDIQKLYMEVSFDGSKEEISYKAKLLDGKGIDVNFRYLKL